MRIKHFILLILLSFMVLGGFAQTAREFWFAVPKITKDHPNNAPSTPANWRFFFRFTNMNQLHEDTPNHITISMPANPLFEPLELAMPPGGVANIDVTNIIEDLWVTAPWDQALSDERTYNRGIYIESTYNMTAYFEVGNHFNPDIFSLKGYNALGMEFYVPFQNRSNNGHGYSPDRPYSGIYIVATEDNTTVTVNPSRPAFDDQDEPFSLTLNRGQSVAISPHQYLQNAGRLPENRLAGTHVMADRPIAITTSDDSVHGITGCYDLIGDQLIPTTVIGKEYIAMKGELTASEYFYVFATTDSTFVYLDGAEEKYDSLDAGEFLRIEFQKARYHIRTTHPSYVYHVGGFGCEVGGAVLPPIDVCTGSFKVAFTRSKAESFFLNILVRTGAEDGFTFNGGDANTFITADQFQAVPGTTQWLSANIEVTQAQVPVGVATVIENEKDVFHLGIINGGPSSGTMYGYFSNFNQLEVAAGVGEIGQGIHGIFMCHGESQVLVSTDGVSHYWYPSDYLDDPTSQNPVVTPGESMVYTVVITGACQVTAEAQLAIYLIPPVNALYTIEDAVGCAPFELEIENQSHNVYDYIWDFGDGNVSYTDNVSFTHTYENTGPDPVQYTLQLAGYLAFCSDTLETEITVLPEVRTKLRVTDHEPDTANVITGCAPFELDFYHAETLNVQSFLWDFGDGNTSGSETPQHTFHNYTAEPVVYPVILKGSSEFGIDGACEARDTVYIKVNPYVKAGFDFDPPAHCNPYPVTIQNTSTGAANSYWDFLNESDTLINASQFTHLLVNETSETEHTIRLWVENDYGCYDELVRNVTVYPLLTAEFEPSEWIACEPGLISFDNFSQGASQYHWDFDGAGSSSETSPQNIEFINHSLEEEQTYHVHLTAVSAYGCVEDTIIPVTVATRLKAGFTIEDAELCSPHGEAVLEIQNHSLGASRVEYTITNDYDAEQVVFENEAQSFFYTFYNDSPEPVEYLIVQRVENDRDCYEEKTLTVTVYPRVRASIVPVESGCHPLEVDFTHDALNASLYRWEFSDGSTYLQESVQKTFVNHSYTQSLQVEAQLFVESEYGCKHDTLYTFTVHPRPKADFNIPVAQGCSPLPVDFVDQSIVTGGLDYTWTLGGEGEVVAEPGHASHIFQNPTDAAFTEVVWLHITNEYGCADSLSRNVMVYPDIEAVFSVSTVSGCDSLEVILENTSSGASAALPYHWKYGEGTSNTIQDVHSRIFRNFSHSEPQDYLVKLWAYSAYGCVDSTSHTITVYPRPHADFSVNQHTGCSPMEVEFQDLSLGADLDYQWLLDEEVEIQEAGNVDHAYHVAPGGVLTHFQPQLTITNSWGCSHTYSRQITVYPQAEAVFSLSQEEGCHPLEITLENQGAGDYSYSWDLDDGNQSEQASLTHVFMNTSYNQTSEFVVALDVVTPYGCTARKEKTVSVFPRPVASFATSASQGCSPLSIDFEDTSKGTGQETYLWQFDNIQVNESGDISHVFRNLGAESDTLPALLTLANEYGCMHMASRQIVVFPAVKADFEVANPQGCHPLEVTFLNNSEGANAADPYSWDYGNGTSNESQPQHIREFSNFSHTEVKEYTVNLQAESVYGCTHLVSKSIRVFPVPRAQYHVEEPTGCSPHTPVFEDLSQGTQLDYLWTFEEGHIDNHPGDVTHTYTRPYDAEPGVFTSSLFVVNEHGCSHTYEKPITVYPHVEALFSSIEGGCHPLTVEFENSSLGVQNHQWAFGDDNYANTESPTHTFYNTSHRETKEFMVTLDVVSPWGCTANTSKKIEVYPLPRASFVPDVLSGCSPLEVLFSDESQGTGNEEYLWSMGNEESDVQDDLLHVFHHSGDYADTLQVSLHLMNEYACEHSYAKQLVVFPDISASFTVMEAEGCHPLESVFTNHSMGATGDTPYFWSYGNGTSSAEAPQHSRVFNNFSHTDVEEFTIQLLAESAYGCRDSVTQIVTVYPVPQAHYQVDEAAGCSPHTVLFEDLSQGTQLDYLWSFDDGQIHDQAGDVSHTYHRAYNLDPGLFSSSLLVTNAYGCSHTQQKLITVYPDVEASYTANLEGCHPLEVNFENQSLGGQYFNWHLGDGNQSEDHNVSNTYFNQLHDEASQYTAILHVVSSYGCEDTFEDVVRVYPLPRALFSASATEGCSPFPVDFSDASLGTGNESYLWQLGDLGIEQQGDLSYTFSHDGEFADTLQIALTLENEFACVHTHASQLVIYPNIEAAFSIQNFEGCHPLEAVFVNQSSGATAASPYIWNYGNGTSETEQEQHARLFHNFSHTEVQNYVVQLLAKSMYGCRDSVEKHIQVFPVPRAHYQVEEHTGCSPFTVYFEDLSQGTGLEYVWTFEEGETDDQQGNTQYTYHRAHDAGAGVFESSLWVANTYGCEDQRMQNITVYPDVEAAFSFNEQGCHPLQVQFENQSLGAQYYQWNFDDDNFANSANPVHVFHNNSFTEPMTFDVELSALSSFGCAALQTHTVTVFPKPRVDFAMQNSKGCSPLSVAYQNLSEGVSSYAWDLGGESWDGSEVDFSRIFVNQGQQPDTLSMWLVGENAWGCSRSIGKEVVVYPEVTAAFSSQSGSYEGCTPLSMSFENESQLAKNYLWTFGDGTTSTNAHPSHKFYNYTAQTKDFSVGLKATSVYGCEDFTSRQVKVFATPVADFDASPHQQFYPARTVYVANYSSPGDWDFHWEMGDGHSFTTRSREMFEHTYPWPPGDYSGREFEISLQVASAYCNSEITQRVSIVAPFPVVGFSPSAQGCPPLEVQFYNETLYGISFLWDFDDGHTSEEEHPRHVFADPGEYKVMLRIVGEGGVDSTYQTITVFEPPVADFRIENPTVELPYEWAQFLNLSTNAQTYFWEFGDGNFSEEEHPRHYFAHTGAYDVTLIVGNDTDPQCYDTIVKPGMVTVQDMSCQLMFPNAFKPSPEGAIGGEYTLNDPSSHIFHPVHEGIEEYKLQIFNRWGELIFVSEDIWVGWDGYYRGSLSPMGVYVYKVEARCSTGRKIEKTGDVTLLR